MKRQLLTALAFALSCALPASAQVAPSLSQIKNYSGLLAAAHTGDNAKIKALLATQSPPDVRDPQQRTPLHIATFARQRDAIRLLAGAGANLDALEFQHYDAVTIAAVADDEETLSLLLQLGASAGNTTSPYAGTALIAAAHLGHVGVVKQLIRAGAPLDHLNNLHWTALIEAVVLGDGGPRHSEIVRLLLDAGADRRLTDRNGNTPLVLARARGFSTMVQFLEAADEKQGHQNKRTTP